LNCKWLTTVFFTNNSHLRQISGFQRCGSLCQIEIPRFVEVIYKDDFKGCQSLREVRFSMGSSIREIRGFHDCCSLSYVEIPRSIECTHSKAFSGCDLCFQIH
jgi:hypothetical protein